MAAGFGSIWLLADDGAQTKVERVDPDKLTVTATIPTGAGAVSITAGANAIWVPNNDDGTVTRIDPATNRARTVNVGGSPWVIGVGDGSVWLVDGNGLITRLDPRTAKPLSKPYDFSRYMKYRFQAGDHDIVVGDGALWLYDAGTETLRFAVKHGALGAVTKLHSAATMTLDGDSLWASAVDPNVVFKMSARTGRILVRTPGFESNFVINSRGVWGGARGVLSHLDPRTARVISSVKVGSPGNIVLAAYQNRIWVFNIFDGTLTKLVS
jgi:streptogramin lyase